jgi:hypothetical protein
MLTSELVRSGEPRQTEQARREKPTRACTPSNRTCRGGLVRPKFAVRLVSALIFLGILAASFPVAELVFRLLGDEPSFDLRGLYAPFANGNYKLAPEVQTSARFASGPLTVCTDAFGLRCDKGKRFGADRSRPISILIVGDSQGFGNGVNFEDTIAGSMAVLAGQRGYRVSNASVGGHSLASQLQLAKWLIDEQGLKVKDFILLLTPAMIHSPGKLNQATVGPDGRLYAGPSTGARLRRWVKSNLVVYSRLRDAVRNLGIGADATRDASTVFSFYDKVQGGTMQELLAMVQEFKTFAASHGAGIELVYVPLTIEATFDSVQRAAAKENMSLDPNLPYQIAAAVAAHLHIPLHDLRPALQEAHSNRETLTVTGDFHYSPVLSHACGVKLWAELALPPKKINDLVNANRSN